MPSDPNFPVNPTDKMIVEIEPGSYFQYDQPSNTWVRLQGFDQYINLASTTQDGLMSKEDYRKLTGLIVPPPYTALTNGTCKYTSGIIGLTSSEQDLIIDTQVDLYGLDKQTGQSLLVKKTVFKIHENTYGIDFRVNMDKLVSTLTSNGQLTYQQQVGSPGLQGARGPKGRDRLDTGPVGSPGIDGQSIPWPYSLTEDTAAELASPGRGIVSITTNEVSPTENYLVVTRANVGNIQSCPNQISPANVNSPWILVIDETPAVIQTLNCNVSKTQLCNNQTLNCGGTPAPIQYCTSRLYYVDIGPIEEAVEQQYTTLVSELQTAKEQLVNDYITTIMNVYAQCKNAVCCALGNVISKQANRKLRLQIENMRIQAAQANMQLVLGDINDASFVYNLNTGIIQTPSGVNQNLLPVTPNVPPSPGSSAAPVITGQPQNQAVATGSDAVFSVAATGENLKYQWYVNGTIYGDNSPVLTISHVTTSVSNTPVSVTVSNTEGSTNSITVYLIVLPSPNVPQEVLREISRNMSREMPDALNNNCPDVAYFSLDGASNTTELNGITHNIPAGDYYVFVSECCNMDTTSGQYNLPISIVYQQDNTRPRLNLPDNGSYTNLTDALNVYNGLSLRFKHDGGLMTMFVNSSTSSKSVLITLKDAACVDQAASACATPPIYPSSGSENPEQFTCEVGAQTVQWYEMGWRTGACCGLWVTAGGVDWIVVMRSIGTDVTCGGGANANEPCILAGEESAGVQPAYAFPTINGDEFIGMPTSSQTMIRNIDLESQIFTLLYGNSPQVHKVKGDPKTNLQAIVFPTSI